MSKEYNYPVWSTQGGGLAREVDGIYIFIEKPDCPGLDVGDEVPEEWGVIPANNAAQDEMVLYENEGELDLTHGELVDSWDDYWATR